jgi:hypothetical protein
VRRPAPAWKLESFEERLDLWAELEKPPIDLRLVVAEWVITRMDDPYQGVRRESGFPNLWFGCVPNSGHEGRVVVCSYWVAEREKLVRCDQIASLSSPV